MVPRIFVRIAAAAICLTAVAFLLAVRAPSAVAQEYEMIEIGDGVFVFRMNNRNAPLVITDQGALVMDPQNEVMAPLIKAEIARRTDAPVKYVVYSHASTDHIRGAGVFADTAKFIAQRRQVPRLEYVKEDSFPMPDLLFDDRMEIELGGKTIILRDFGINHATGVTVMHIPADKVITALDIVYVHRLAFFYMPDFNPRAWRDSLRRIQKLDFDKAVVGHGDVYATKAEFIDFADYLDDLLTQVEAIWERENLKGPYVGIDAALREVDLGKYKDWGFYDRFRDLNIMAAYNSIDMGF